MKTVHAVRLKHFTPLRYPGGKAKLARYVKRILEVNHLCDGAYVEPYSGGAGIACELVVQEYVSEVYINDISRPVWAFWYSVLHNTEDLLRRLWDIKITVRSWDRQKRVLENVDDHSELEIGFAAFFLNRTSRSGIFNAGVIGGRDQSGNWKIDARFNKPELAARIAAIAKFRSRISLSNLDAREFLRRGIRTWPSKALVYLDPPYYVKGQHLYLNFYSEKDHERIADLLLGSASNLNWIVSYDDVAPVRKMYAGLRNIEYSLAYSAREPRKGSEVMFFSPTLNVPEFACL